MCNSAGIGIFGNGSAPGSSYLVFLIRDLHHDESETAHDSDPDEDEDAAHVLEAEGGGAVVVAVAAVNLATQ